MLRAIFQLLIIEILRALTTDEKNINSELMMERIAVGKTKYATKFNNSSCMHCDCGMREKSDRFNRYGNTFLIGASPKSTDVMPVFVWYEVRCRHQEFS